MKKTIRTFILAFAMVCVLVLGAMAQLPVFAAEPTEPVDTSFTIPDDIVIGTSAVYPGLIEHTTTVVETTTATPTTEDVVTEPPVETEVPSTDGTEEVEVPPDEDVESPNFFNRIVEYCYDHKAGIVNVASGAGVVALYLIQGIQGGKKLKKVSTEITNNTAGSNGQVIGAVNGLIDSYNIMDTKYKEVQKQYEEHAKTEAERDRILGQLIVVDMATLEILMAVYPNSKNLPQGVKDLINIKYAHMLQNLDDDEKLIKIVEYLRGKSVEDFKTQAVEPVMTEGETTENTEV